MWYVKFTSAKVKTRVVVAGMAEVVYKSPDLN